MRWNVGETECLVVNFFELGALVFYLSSTHFYENYIIDATFYSARYRLMLPFISIFLRKMSDNSASSSANFFGK